LLNSAKRSLLRFLVIYLASTFFLFGLATLIFYNATKHHLFDMQRESLKYDADKIISSLRELHFSNASSLIYPHKNEIYSAIFDADRNYIIGTFEGNITLEGERDRDYLYHVDMVEPYYLGAAYILTAKKVDLAPIKELQLQILFFLFVAGVFFSILGYYLGRLFVAPMRNSIEQMNHFIQDATHELNTPISTILTNIEMIETFGKHREHEHELKRIEIASRTLSRIYDDLTYLNLNHQYHRNIDTIDMSRLLKERIVYFSGLIASKHLQLKETFEEHVILQIDKNDAIRLMDNLISNAIKYNKQEGILDIRLDEYGLSVRDTGIGITKKDIGIILQRFKRVDKSEGGFGVGLDIVKQVVEYYNFEISINSQLNVGTEVYVSWEK
jgi:two-component system OmpR family sensor kinase